MRRLLVVGALCALVALAGCSGVLPGGDEGGERLPNASTVIDDHRAALEAAGSFTYASRRAIEVNASGEFQQTQYQRRVVRVDVDTGRYLLERDTPGRHVIEVYAAGNGTGYRRVDNRTAVATRPRHDAEYYVEHTTLRRLLTNVTLRSDGETTVEGTNVTEYVSTDVEGFRRAFFAGRDTNLTVETAEVRLYRTDDGLVKRVTLLANFTQGDRKILFTQRVTIREVGTTTVERPAWAGNRSTAIRSTGSIAVDRED